MSLLENCLVLIDSNQADAAASVLLLLDLADDQITEPAALDMLNSAKALLSTTPADTLPAVRILIENVLAMLQ